MAGPLDLVFFSDDREPLELVFGDDGSAGTGPEYSIAGGGTITGLGRAQAELVYDINVQRQLLARQTERWQDGQPLGQALRSSWEPASQLTRSARVVNEAGLPAACAVRSQWQDAQQVARSVRVRDQLGVHLGTGVRSAFEQALALAAAQRSRFQPGRAVESVALARFQEALQLAVHVRSAFELGRSVVTDARSDMQPGLAVRPVWRLRFQRGRYPPPGGLPAGPGPDNRGDWCYVPSDPIELVFESDARAPLDLLFRCERAVPGPQPGTVVIPVRSTYVVQNNVTLHRVPSGDEFVASRFNLQIDADSFTFSWSASLHISARAHLGRSEPGERIDVECAVNGVLLRLVIEKIGRDRSFPEHRIAVSGRGRAAELADTDLTFTNPADRTAQQLMADVLTVNGVSMGWALDWQITDWFVPADRWVFRGSYIGALQDIASAAGAYIQPHLTAKTLRVLPRYPHAPWDWATLLPVDIELPVEATTVVGFEEVIRPDHNRVFVGGVIQPGYFGPVTRGGTAGDKVALPIVHPLITAPEAHIQRGRAELSNTGVQEMVSVRTLVLPETGIILPGKALRFVDEDGPRLGLVRSTNVSMDTWPVMHQTVEVETHAQ